MISAFNTYRRLIFSLLLSAYVLGVFQSSVCETIHFFCHFKDLNSGSYQFHSFSSHDYSHQHSALDLIFENDKEKKDSETPLSEDKLKKKNELFSADLNIEYDWSRTPKCQFIFLMNRFSNFSKVPEEPPRA